VLPAHQEKKKGGLGSAGVIGQGFSIREENDPTRELRHLQPLLVQLPHQLLLNCTNNRINWKNFAIQYQGTYIATMLRISRASAS
jgi:hypothetical protein